MIRRMLSLFGLVVLGMFVLAPAPARGAAAAGAGPEIAVSGRALGPKGAPLAEADVQILPSLDPVQQARLADAARLPKAVSHAVTDAQGRFVVSAPSAGLYRVRLEAPGYVPVEAVLEPLLEPTDLPDVEMTPDGGLVVKVTGRAGKPVAGARVRLAPPDTRASRFEQTGWSPAVRTVMTDERGAAMLPRGVNERSVLTASAPGYLVVERQNVRGTAVILSLEPGTDRTIGARSGDGTPATGVLVLARASSHPLGFTDARGLLEVAIPAKGRVELDLVAGDGRRVRGEIAAPASPGAKGAPAASAGRAGGEGAEGAAAAASAKPGAPRVFVLPDRALVRGRMIDRRTRAPIQGGLVWPGGELWGAATTDATGRFTVKGAPKQSLELRAAATGYLGPQSIDIMLSAEQPQGPTLALKPAASIEGTVVDESGGPVAGAEVTIEVKQQPGMMVIRMGREAPGPRAVSTSRGTFRLSRVDPENNYDLKVAATGFAPAAKEIVGLEPQVPMSSVRVELSRGLSVTGVVVDADGKPIREVEATLRKAQRTPQLGGAIMMEDSAPAGGAPHGTTDNDGRFRIGGLASGAYELDLQRHGFAKKHVAGLDVSKPGEPVDLGTIAMQAGARLQGIVTGPGGDPIEGVEVAKANEPVQPFMAMMPRRSARKDPPVATTGPDGRFAVEDLTGGEKTSLSFSRAGYLDTKKTALDVPPVDPLVVVLKPSSKVSGVVNGPDGKPVPRANVTMSRTVSGGIGNQVIQMMVRDGTIADDEGRFVFENLSPGQISLTAVSPGWREAKLDGIEVPEGKDVEGLELPLKPGAVVTGRVVGPDGRAAIGARVALVTEESSPIRMGGAVSDGDGNYRLDGVAPGRVSIEATHDSYVRTVKELEARAGPNTLNLQFEGGQEVSGIVADTGGAPIAGASVQLASAGRGWGGPEARSAADGTFHIAGVGDGDYSLSVAREGYAPPAEPIAVHVAGKPVADLRVALGKGGTIVGTVSGVDPEKITQVGIRAMGPGAPGGGPASVDAQGGYRLTGLPAGTWTVVASLQSTGQQARGTVVVEPGETEARLDLQFGSGLTLSGRALAGETPVKGAVLFARGTDVNNSAWGRSDDSGSFRFEGLQPGTYQVELRVWETGLSYEEKVELPASRDIVLKIPTTRIVGRIVDGADSKPIAGVTVALTQPSQAAPSPITERGATSDLNGRFEIANVPAGTWTLTATRTGYAASTLDVSVESGHDAENVKLSLDATDGLTFQARLASGRIPDTVDVAVLDSAGRAITSGSFATGENGRVRLSSVPPGSWELLVSAGGSGVMTLRVGVPGETASVVLPPACALKVRVPALADTTAAATATVLGPDGRPFRELGWMGDPVGQWRLAAGRFQLDTLPPGSWTVQVAAADGRTWSGSSATKPGAAAEVELR